MEQMTGKVRRNDALSRYELEIDGHLSIAEFREDGGVITFTHTESPPALRGRGAGTQLIRDALFDVRARGMTARATCSFVSAYLKRHKEFADLLG